MTKSEYNLNQIINKHNTFFKERLLELITSTYLTAIIDIDRSNFDRKYDDLRPRIDYFLRSSFFFIFSKIHKNNKQKALELLSEIISKIDKIE